MSDNIPPFDIQAEIMKRLPIKSLIQFRSVSKPWKSLIDSPKFINDHTNHNQPHHHHDHHLLVRYKLNSERKYISIIDNNDNDSISFPRQQFSVTAPRILNLLRYALVLGSSDNGLLCFYGLYRDTDYQTEMVILWNPSIRKSVGIVVPNVLYVPSGRTSLGFGICPNTSDPKLVKVNHIVNSLSESEIVTWEVEVFTLSSGKWRRISNKMPRTSVDLSLVQVFIDGVIYWQAYDKIPNDDVEARYNRIISFDLTSEEFGEVHLPDRFTNATKHFISKLMGSLVVLEDCIEDEKLVCVVWKIEHTAQKSLKRLFTIKAPDNALYNSVLSFRKNGEPITETVYDYEESTTLQVYDHNSGCFKDLGIHGNGGSLTSCSVTSYRETLLLLDKPDAIIY